MLTVAQKMAVLPRGTTGTSNPTILPTNVAGLAAWYDASVASSITSVAGAVSQWNDRSGNGRNLTQSTAIRKPTTGTRTINGLNALDFTNNFIDSAPVSIVQPVTLLAVVLADSYTGAANRYIDTWTGAEADRIIMFRLTSTPALQVFAGSSANTTHDMATGAAHVHSAVFNGATSSFFEDGTQYGGALNPGTGPIYQINLGGDGFTSAADSDWDGLIAEVLIYGAALSAGNRRALENYLKIKWRTP